MSFFRLSCVLKCKGSFFDHINMVWCATRYSIRKSDLRGMMNFIKSVFCFLVLMGFCASGIAEVLSADYRWTLNTIAIVNQTSGTILPFFGVTHADIGSVHWAPRQETRAELQQDETITTYPSMLSAKDVISAETSTAVGIRSAQSKAYVLSTASLNPHVVINVTTMSPEIIPIGQNANDFFKKIKNLPKPASPEMINQVQAMVQNMCMITIEISPTQVRTFRAIGPRCSLKSEGDSITLTIRDNNSNNVKTQWGPDKITFINGINQAIFPAFKTNIPDRETNEENGIQTPESVMLNELALAKQVKIEPTLPEPKDISIDNAKTIASLQSSAYAFINMPAHISLETSFSFWMIPQTEVPHDFPKEDWEDGFGVQGVCAFNLNNSLGDFSDFSYSFYGDHCAVERKDNALDFIISEKSD